MYWEWSNLDIEIYEVGQNGVTAGQLPRVWWELGWDRSGGLVLEEQRCFFNCNIKILIKSYFTSMCMTIKMPPTNQLRITLSGISELKF